MDKFNFLFNARNHWTPFQINLLIALIHKVKKDDIAFKIYSFRLKNIFLQKMSFSELRSATNILLNRVYEVENDEQIYQITLIVSVGFKRNEGIIEIIIHPLIKIYFSNLKEKYTLVSIQSLLSFKSRYSKKLYEWLKSSSITPIILDIKHIKQEFEIENQYQDYNTFKKRVILQAQKELAHSDFPFFFEEKKGNRKIERIQFIPINIENIPISFQQENLLRKLVKDTRITVLQARKIVIKFTKEEIFALLFLIKKAEQRGRIRTSLAGYTVGVFNTILKHKI